MKDIDEAIQHCEDVAQQQDILKGRYDDASGYTRSGNEAIRTSDAKKCEKCAADYRQLAEWLKELKQLREQTRWIPVSERLPEEAFGCLVTIFDTDLRTQDEFENILPYFVGYDDETWNDADGEPIPFEVIAWMPSPKPYKAESEDKE